MRPRKDFQNAPTPPLLAGVRAVLLFLALLLTCGSASADEEGLRRALVSTKIFGAFLAADIDIEAKVAPDGRLHVLLVHRGDPEITRQLHTRLTQLGRIRNHELVVTPVHVDQLTSYAGPPPAGLFIAESLPTLTPAIEHARGARALVFSPLVRDLERGAHGSMHVSDQLLPEVSDSALRSGGIELKPVFLGVARHVQ